MFSFIFKAFYQTEAYYFHQSPTTLLSGSYSNSEGKTNKPSLVDSPYFMILKIQRENQIIDSLELYSLFNILGAVRHSFNLLGRIR